MHMAVQGVVLRLPLWERGGRADLRGSPRVEGAVLSATSQGLRDSAGGACTPCFQAALPPLLGSGTRSGGCGVPVPAGSRAGIRALRAGGLGTQPPADCCPHPGGRAGPLRPSSWREEAGGVGTSGCRPGWCRGRSRSPDLKNGAENQSDGWCDSAPLSLITGERTTLCRASSHGSSLRVVPACRGRGDAGLRAAGQEALSGPPEGGRAGTAALSRRMTDAVISLPEAGPGPSWASAQPGLGSCAQGVSAPRRQQPGFQKRLGEAACGR